MLKTVVIWTLTSISLFLITLDAVTYCYPVSWHCNVNGEDVYVFICGPQCHVIISKLGTFDNDTKNFHSDYELVSPIGTFFVEKVCNIKKKYSRVIAFGFSLRIFSVLFLMYPLVIAIIEMYRHSIKNKRLKMNCCVRCSYNLTGNVSGVCTECGLILT